MKVGSLPTRAALVAAALGATAAFGASSALATTTQLDGANLSANGSSLQKVAQLGSSSLSKWTTTTGGLTGLWTATPADRTFKNANSGVTYEINPTSGAGPSVTYASTGSGQGLATFGNASSSACSDSGAGKLAPDCDPNYGTSGVLDGFIGTDDPPTASQLQSANAAANGGTNNTGTAKEVTVPVFQAPVAIVLSLPHGITLGSGTKLELKNTLLQNIYDDAVGASKDYAAGTYGALLEDAGLTLVASAPKANQFTDPSKTGGANPVVREVRQGGSGTTYATQGFLSLSGDTTYSAYSDNEALWPGGNTTGTDPDSTTTDGCPAGGSGSSDCPTSPVGNYENGYDTGTGGGSGATGNHTGGELVENTVYDPGTIGYANLADAATAISGFPVKATAQTTSLGGSSHQVLYAYIQNNYDGSGGSNTPTYTLPGTVGGTTTAITVSTNVSTANANTSGTYDISNNTGAGVGDWSVASTTYGQSYGSSVADDPNVANHAASQTAKYGIVAATYDVAWSNYTKGILEGSTAYNSATQAEQTANSTVSYLAWETGAGATKLAGSSAGYQKLPTNIAALADLDWEAIPVYTGV